MPYLLVKKDIQKKLHKGDNNMGNTGKRNRGLAPAGSSRSSSAQRRRTTSPNYRSGGRGVARRKTRKKFNFGGCLFRIIIVIFLCVAGFFFLQSDIFTVKSIEVRGVERLNEEEIIALSGIETGLNLFEVNRNEAEELIELHAGVNSAAVNTRPPHKILITVQERDAVAWIPGDECYYIMDEEGYIFIKRDEYNDYLPLITGLDQPENLSTGLRFTEVKGLDDSIHIAKVFGDYCRGQMRELHYTAKGNFIFYIGELQVRLGKNQEMWKKKNVLDGILQQIPANALGQVEYIDVSSPSSPVVAGYDIVAAREKAEAEEKAKKEAEKNNTTENNTDPSVNDNQTTPESTDNTPEENDSADENGESQDNSAESRGEIDSSSDNSTENTQ